MLVSISKYLSEALTKDLELRNRAKEILRSMGMNPNSPPSGHTVALRKLSQTGSQVSPVQEPKKKVEPPSTRRDVKLEPRKPESKKVASSEELFPPKPEGASVQKLPGGVVYGLKYRTDPREDVTTRLFASHHMTSHAGKKPEKSLVFHKVDPGSRVLSFHGNYPGEYTIHGSQQFSPQGRIAATYQLYSPGERVVSIDPDRSVVVLDKGKRSRFAPGPATSKMIQNEIERHAWAAHGSSPDKERSYPMDASKFDTFGIPAEQWRLPASHPAATVGRDLRFDR